MTRFILPLFCLLVAAECWSKTVRLNEKFTTSLMKVLTKEGANMVISPVNMVSAVGVISYGAENDTAKQIFNALGYQTDQAEPAISEKERHLHENTAPGVTRSSSDRIMFASTFPLKDSYVNAVRQDFPQIKVENFDFKRPAEAADEINSWVSDMTHNKIKKILDPGSIGPSTAMINLNAIYFKGKWKNSFNKKQTSQGCFYPQESQCVHTNLMRQESSFKYGFNYSMNAKIIELPFMDEDYSMVVVLPQKYNDLMTLIAKLNVDKVLNYVDSRQEETVDVVLPRFEVKFKQEINSTLNLLGVKLLFSSRADLSRMSIVKNVSVDSVLQKAKLICREEMTVSSACIGDRSMIHTQANYIIENSDVKATKQTGTQEHEYKESFWATSPFLYLIRGKAGVLFSGVYSTPPEKKLSKLRKNLRSF